MISSQGRAFAVERIAGVALFVVVSAWAATTQQPARLFGDGQEYWQMSQQFANGQEVLAANGPFIFRPATPWLAAAINPTVREIIPGQVDRLIEDALGLHDVAPYYVLGTALSLLTLLLLQSYLRCFVEHAGIRLLVVTMWITQWHAPVRWGYFYPVNVEPLFLSCATAALLTMERMRERPLWAFALLLCPLICLGTFARESMLLLAVVFLLDRSRHLRRGVDVVFVLLPLVLSLGVVLMTRRMAVVTNDYNAWNELVAMLSNKPVFTWLLAWFFAFGPPAIALILSARRELWQLVSTRPALMVHLAGCGVLAFVGGTDTERILGWAAPVLMVLVGVAIEEQRGALRRAPLLVGLLVVVHIASSRMLWPIPGADIDTVPLADLGVSWQGAYQLLNRLLVIENYYSNLWSYFGNRWVQAAILAFDVAFVLVVAAVIRRRLEGVTLSPATPPALQSPGTT